MLLVDGSGLVSRRRGLGGRSLARLLGTWGTIGDGGWRRVGGEGEDEKQLLGLQTIYI